jgi:ankyrin repeat protein
MVHFQNHQSKASKIYTVFSKLSKQILPQIQYWIIILLILSFFNCASSQNSIYLTAADTGDLTTIQKYKSEGGDLNSKEAKFGNSALHLASYRGHTEVVDYLLKNGLDANLRANDGITPLIAASTKGHIKIVQLLLSKGADPKLSDDFGITPLMAASYIGNKEITKEILKLKPDVNARNKNGKSALDKASNPEIIQMLIKAGATR